jgi:hypothetical protein
VGETLSGSTVWSQISSSARRFVASRALTGALRTNVARGYPMDTLRERQFNGLLYGDWPH